MQTEKKQPDKQDMFAIVMKIFFAVVAVAYFVTVLFGKHILGENNWIYIGLNIFLPTEAPNVWLRSLGYIVFMISLSVALRFFLRQFSKLVKKGKALLDLFCSFIKYIAVIVMLFAILKTWGVNTTALLAGIGILSLVVGLGAQPLIEDIIAGLFIVFEGVYDVGDIIVVEDFRGTVKEIGIRTTQIEDAGGDIKVINNSDIRTLINMTSQLSLALTEVDIEYCESLERVELLIKNNLAEFRKNIPDIADGPFYMGVSKLGSSGVTLRLTAKCIESRKYQVERDLNRQIKLMFDRYNINIPFPQVVVHEGAKSNGSVTVTQKKEADTFVEEQRNLTRDIGMDEKSL